MVGIEGKYGLPLFTKDHSTDYIVKYFDEAEYDRIPLSNQVRKMLELMGAKR